ncbi:MAG: hypothetical protein V7459_02490 [Oceanicoccus sp.]
MKTKNLNRYVSVYKELLKSGDVQIAYAELVKYVQKLKTGFSKDFSNDYSVGNVLQGYMDYTYFYLTNDYLKSRKLKLGLVLNHAEAHFEIWLLGQTKAIQEEYWDRLKKTEWIEVTKMPQYSVFEVILVKKPNFEDLDKLTGEVKEQFKTVADAILVSLKKVA